MTKIHIHGYKSIRDPQQILIGKRITFLVGPNSAGKSVLLHALNDLMGDSPNFDLDHAKIHRNPNENAIISAFHTLGVEWKSGDKKLGYYTAYVSDKLEEDSAVEGVPRMVKHDSFIEHPYEKKVIVQIDNTVRLSTITRLGGMYAKFFGETNNEYFHINLDAIEIEDANRLRACMEWVLPELKKAESTEIIKSKADDANFVEALSASLQEGTFIWWPSRFRSKLEFAHTGPSRQKVLNALERFNAIVNRYRRRVVRQVSETYPGTRFRTAVVGAQRVLPQPSELSALVQSSSPSNIYHEVMASAISKTWGEKTFRSAENSFDWRFADHGRLIDSVNDALSQSLFSDVGYQIRVSTQILLSKEEAESAIQYRSLEPEQCEFFCTMALLDSHGRNLSFDEVGSGIGYVLPVLIECFRKSSAGKIVFLQQPELHLHPALQASLADVLIEASNDRSIVAETHSEHTILRALKRVRQTTNGTLKDQSLALQAEDLAVNYFEPLPDGSTKVHILRVSSDGDFLDRWPGGFFADRDKELFDE